MNEQNTICPWCQTEIVWDPEIGPEEVCPHCFNELGSYRSIQVNLKTGASRHEPDGEPDEDDEDVLDEDEWDGLDVPDAEWVGGEDLDTYGEAVQACLEQQEEAPECVSCRELMLHAGDQEVAKEAFTPVVPLPLGKPFLHAPYKLQVYVCPSCFKVETRLGEADRLLMVEALKDAAIKR
ncbi:hypothetical protein SD70_30160 [Gordoniibacillus kamchatkensis]|uniref:Uncharacterized protein n=1 Tax=Gordoniibacillus kamchatkensis TaxID=1590651 RepID=A0ABR5A9Y2_9BACL|nr:hypothetical protein [Paenibacillus sp. VKM B-2647]KIL37871.1 hypothetical protein SD70_30160 [Paenibacillus sp. VKM B-2647]